jgi:hypothetical protein
MEITTYSVLDWLTGAILAASSIVIYYLGKKSLSARLFALLTFSVSIWSFLIAIAVSAKTIQTILLATRFNHLFGTIIASIFFSFALSYPYEKKIDKKIIFTMVGVEMIFVYFFFFTDLIITGAVQLPHLKYLTWIYGPFISLFDLYFAFCWLTGIGLIFLKFKKAQKISIHQNLRLMLLALVIGVIPPTVITILLPQIGIYDYYWLAPVSGLIWILLIAYSITRHHLFNIKVIAIELVTFALWVIIFIRALFAGNAHEAIIESVLLVITVIFGISLIRSALHEITQREKIEKLEAELKEAYERTKYLNEHAERKT